MENFLSIPRIRLDGCHVGTLSLTNSALCFDCEDYSLILKGNNCTKLKWCEFGPKGYVEIFIGLCKRYCFDGFEKDVFSVMNNYFKRIFGKEFETLQSSPNLDNSLEIVVSSNIAEIHNTKEHSSPKLLSQNPQTSPQKLLQVSPAKSKAGNDSVMPPNANTQADESRLDVSDDDSVSTSSNDDDEPVTGKRKKKTTSAPRKSVAVENADGTKSPKKRDKNMPKGCKSKHTLHYDSVKADLKKEFPDKLATELMAIARKIFKGLTKAEKQIFEDIARRDKERFDREMETYKPMTIE